MSRTSDHEAFVRHWKSRPHVILLGAGASRAALPHGDANGRVLPVMKDFVEVVGLEDLLHEMGVEHESRNIEDIYAELAAVDHPDLARLESAIYRYFDGLRLPDYPTIYDYLVLSVRKPDMIATFNWDPFLIQAIRRNGSRVEEPRLVFLHGNVWVGFCARDKVMGTNRTRCSQCGDVFTPSKLLYPIKKKDYAADEFIAGEWDAFRYNLQQAAFFTIFGYSAPRSDIEAIDAVKAAWGAPEERQFEQIEIIDIRDEDELRATWQPLIHTHHYDVSSSYFDSWLARHPRRAIDQFVEQFLEAQFIDDHPVPREASGFDELWDWFDRLAAD